MTDDERETARKFAAALGRAVTKSRDELELEPDALFAALLGVMVEQARAARLPEAWLSDWLRDVADVLDGDFDVEKLPKPTLH